MIQYVTTLRTTMYTVRSNTRSNEYLLWFSGDKIRRVTEYIYKSNSAERLERVFSFNQLTSL